MNVPFGFCHCGCGQRTKLARQTSTKERTIKGQPRRYVRNHQPRGSSGANHPAWAGGRRVMKTGYVQLRMPEHPRATDGYVLEHIVLAERALGNALPPKAEVHHVDENRANNRAGNLVICEDHAYHMFLHRRVRALLACGDADALRCEYCGGYDRQSEMHNIARPNGAPRSYHPTCANAYNRSSRAARIRRVGEGGILLERSA